MNDWPPSPLTRASVAVEACCARRRALQSLDTFKDRFRLQDHALAAAKRAVIHGAVPVFRKVPQIVNADLYQSRFAGPAHNTKIQRPGEEFRKDREDIDLHGRTAVRT